MKVLFYNNVKDATITALDANANYPASNIKSQFLKLKYKANGISDTLTFMLPDTISANCFFYSYSNASSMTLKVYSASSTLLETISVDCTYQSGSAFFTLHTNARWFTIQASCPATEDLYIGGVGFGNAITFPYPSASFAKYLINKSEADSSDDGQISVAYIRPLESYSLSFYGVPRSEYHDIIEEFKSVGIGHIWIDISEENHSVYQPLYCTSKMIESPSRDETISFKITILEAR